MRPSGVIGFAGPLRRLRALSHEATRQVAVIPSLSILA
jgi:hypothetical protein